MLKSTRLCQTAFAGAMEEQRAAPGCGGRQTAGTPSSGQLSCGSDPQKPPRLPAMSGTSSMTMSSNVSYATATTRVTRTDCEGAAAGDWCVLCKSMVSVCVCEEHGPQMQSCHSSGDQKLSLFGRGGDAHLTRYSTVVTGAAGSSWQISKPTRLRRVGERRHCLLSKDGGSAGAWPA